MRRNLDLDDYEDIDVDEGGISSNGAVHDDEISDDELLALVEDEAEKPMIVKVLASRKVPDLMALADIPAVMIMPLTVTYTLIQQERSALLSLLRRAERQAREQGINIEESYYFQIARVEAKEKATLETFFETYLTLSRARDGRFLRLFTNALVDSSDGDDVKELAAQ